MLELTLRLVVSLAVVVGLLLVIARLGSRRFLGGSDALIQVVQRQPNTRSSGVAVVTVGSRVLVLGTTEHQINVLAELEPEELLDADIVSLPAPADAHTDAPTDRDPAAPTSPPARIVHPEGPMAAATARRPGLHRATRGTATPAATTPAQAAHQALTGSILSPETWRQALAAATRRAS